MFFDNLKVACAKKGTSPTSLLKSLGMSTSSVTSWKNGVSPSIGTVYKLAEALEVNPKLLLDGYEARFNDYAEGYTDAIDDDMEWERTHTKKAPALTEKDERDIAKDLERIMTQLETEGDLMFDGDPMSDEARESIRAAMKLGLEAAKLKNKERFTPKKYRKEQE